MDEIRRKMDEEMKSIMSGIQKDLKNNFPTLTDEQIKRLTSIVWEKAHATSEFDYYTQDIIDIVEIVVGK